MTVRSIDSLRLARALTKAQEILQQSRIAEIEDDTRTFYVAGSTGHYIVVGVMLDNGQAWHCSCPAATVDCSHILAARKLVGPPPTPEPDDPFDGLAVSPI